MIQPPTALHISSQMGYHITIQDSGQNPLERLWEYKHHYEIIAEQNIDSPNPPFKQ